jgi:Flp pilus assembly protein TadD
MFLGATLAHHGKRLEAEAEYRKVLQSEPDNALALNNLGYSMLERDEKLNEAFQMIQRAVKSDPNNPSYLDSLGWAYFKLGKLSEAETHLNNAARINTNSPTVQEHLGDLYQKQGNTGQARAAWQKALTLSVEADQTIRLKTKLNGEKKK